MSVERLGSFDAVFLTGSPMHVYEDTAPVRRQIAFMRCVFAAGVPSFGSCAGLQIAVTAAGGRVRKMPQRMEAAIARRISATPEGATIRCSPVARPVGTRPPSIATRSANCRPAPPCLPATPSPASRPPRSAMIAGSSGGAISPRTGAARDRHCGRRAGRRTGRDGASPA
ncbi:hypothetical protein P0F65_21610 [Sphingomonas sp. I4]